MGRRGRLPLAGVMAVYVVEFVDRVKIGCTIGARRRLRMYLAAGPVRAVVFPWVLDVPSMRAILAVEREALDLATAAGTRLGNSESFADLTCDQAVAIVASTMRAHGQPFDPVAVDLDQLARTYSPTEVAHMSAHLLIGATP